MKATYVSVWDDGYEVRTNCMYDPETNTVYDIVSSDVEGLEILSDEYIELDDMEGTRIRDFNNGDEFNF